MNKKFGAFCLGLFFGISTLAWADGANFKCDPENWLGNPGISSGEFKGTLTANCLITNAQPSGIASGDSYFTDKVSKSTTVNSGPTQETYDNLPSVLYNVTDVADQVTIKSDEHIATDGKTKLIYAAFSTDVQGSGLSSFLKELDVLITVTPTSDPTSYQLVLTTTLGVTKPFFIPDNSFEAEAEKNAKEQYEKKRDQLVPDIANHL